MNGDQTNCWDAEFCLSTYFGEKSHKMTTAYACRWEVQEQLKRIWFAVDVIEGEFSYSDNGNLPSWTFVKSILFVPEIGKQNSATPKF